MRQHNQSINATNIYIINAKCERESDPKNFGARITRIRVVEKLIGLDWNFGKVSRAFLLRQNV
jgi:hypothetical protein